MSKNVRKKLTFNPVNLLRRAFFAENRPFRSFGPDATRRKRPKPSSSTFFVKKINSLINLFFSLRFELFSALVCSFWAILFLAQLAQDFRFPIFPASQINIQSQLSSISSITRNVADLVMHKISCVQETQLNQNKARFEP